MPNSSNYFAGYKVYEFKEIFLWYTYSNLGYHNLRCTCRSYDKAKAVEKSLGCIWFILTLLPILDLMFRSSHIFVFWSLVFLVTFCFFLSCPSCLAKCKQRLCNIFVTSLPKVPKVTKNKKLVLRVKNIALQLSFKHSKPFLAILGNFWPKTLFTWTRDYPLCVFFSKCNSCKRNHRIFQENKGKGQWFERKCAVFMAAWLYPT